MKIFIYWDDGRWHAYDISTIEKETKAKGQILKKEHSMQHLGKTIPYEYTQEEIMALPERFHGPLLKKLAELKNLESFVKERARINEAIDKALAENDSAMIFQMFEDLEKSKLGRYPSSVVVVELTDEVQEASWPSDRKW